MGLDVSHNCFSGSYGEFYFFRQALAVSTGIPPLELMEGFYKSMNQSLSLPTLYHGPDHHYGILSLDKRLPIQWKCLKPRKVFLLIDHSDCDGNLKWQDCAAIAKDLKSLNLMPPWDRVRDQFVKGLMYAASRHEDVDFT